MSFALMIFWEGTPAILSEASRKRLHRLLADLPGLGQGMVYTPARGTSDLYTEDGAGPALGLQVEAAQIETLEAACAKGGGLQALADPAFLPELAGAQVNQQLFVLRRFEVEDAVLRIPEGAKPCSYVVHYPGPAQDLSRWLGHYIESHPPIMVRFPGIRGIEILTRADFVSYLPFAHAQHMQRNRVLFDSPQALTAALHSPVRHEMRADFHTFPAFEGGNFHFAMETDIIGG